MDRRKLLTILGAIVATAGTAGSSIRSALAAPAIAPRRHLQTRLEDFHLFTDTEVNFIKAAVARLIPTDELGPGGVEAGVPYFIDQQLSGAYGAGAHFYKQGPFGSVTPFQGYQLPLSPAQLYRVGIAATDKYFQQTYGQLFAALDVAKQEEVLGDCKASPTISTSRKSQAQRFSLGSSRTRWTASSPILLTVATRT